MQIPWWLYLLTCHPILVSKIVNKITNKEQSNVGFVIIYNNSVFYWLETIWYHAKVGASFIGDATLWMRQELSLELNYWCVAHKNTVIVSLAVFSIIRVLDSNVIMTFVTMDLCWAWISVISFRELALGIWLRSLLPWVQDTTIFENISCTFSWW